MNLDTILYLLGLGSPEGIAIDWVSRLVFWTDSSLKRLEVANVDGSLRKVLLDKNIQNPRGIAVNPELGFVLKFSLRTSRILLFVHSDISFGPIGIDKTLVLNVQIWMGVNVKCLLRIN